MSAQTTSGQALAQEQAPALSPEERERINKIGWYITINRNLHYIAGTLPDLGQELTEGEVAALAAAVVFSDMVAEKPPDDPLLARAAKAITDAVDWQANRDGRPPKPLKEVIAELRDVANEAERRLTELGVRREVKNSLLSFKIRFIEERTGKVIYEYKL